jgi:hypothetical protein
MSALVQRMVGVQHSGGYANLLASQRINFKRSVARAFLGWSDGMHYMACSSASRFIKLAGEGPCRYLWTASMYSFE